MTDDAGNLSIDFLAGFTIFMVAFIYVATLIPGLFIGLQSKSIDYDAVAYRTGVILAEDPGMPSNDPVYGGGWEIIPDNNKEDVMRFGLALTKDTPNILSPYKIDRFFCSTWTSDDYRTKTIFGDYPYQFNISLKDTYANTIRSIGDPLPDGYGYSRRLVKIKEDSNVTINKAQIGIPHPGYPSEYNYTSNASTQVFSIYFNYTHLTGDGPAGNAPAYQINPLSPLAEGVIINITDLNHDSNPLLLKDPSTRVNLSDISIYRSRTLAPLHTIHSIFAHVPVYITDIPSPYSLYVDGNAITSFSPPPEITNNISLIIPPGELSYFGAEDPNTWLNVTLKFNLTDSAGNPREDWFLNSSASKYGVFEYNYNPANNNEANWNLANITQPSLHDGILEVAVW